MKPLYIKRTVLLAALLLVSASALADPFAQTGYQAKTWLVTTFGPFAAIGVIGAGIMALAGMLNGMIFVRILIFLVCVFGCDQVVAMLRSWGGV